MNNNPVRTCGLGIAMLAWLLAAPAMPASADPPAASPLKMIDTAQLVIDQMCGRCFDGAVDVLLKNESALPVHLRLTTTPLTGPAPAGSAPPPANAPRKTACAKITIDGPFDVESRSGAVTTVAAGQVVRARIHVAELSEN